MARLNWKWNESKYERDFKYWRDLIGNEIGDDGFDRSSSGTDSESDPATASFGLGMMTERGNEVRSLWEMVKKRL